MKPFATVVVAALLGVTPILAATPQFGGEKTTWHGFDRYDFLMDKADLAIKPHKASPDERTAVRTQVKGQLRCVVVAPKKPAPGNPWSWRGYYFDHEPQAEVELLKRGFHVGFIGCDAGKPWDAWYAFLTEKHGLSRKPAFIGMSRGGRNAYTWATANPDKVSCIYADNPAVSREAVTQLGALAKADVPVLHVCGSLDPILGNHTLVVESIYRQLGGRISVMLKDGAAHHPHSLRDPKPIADFIERSVQPANGDVSAFVGTAFTKTAFYGTASDYREFPSEKTFVACRGPWFAPCYGPAARPPRRTGEGRRADPARLRQPRPLARQPDARRRAALPGAGRAVHGPRRGRQGAFPDRAEGSEAGRGLHPESATVGAIGPPAARLPLRRHDVARRAGDLPVAGHFHGGPTQRPGRPRRQHPHAQGHGGQVHRPRPLSVDRRGQPAAQPQAGEGAAPQGARGRPRHDPASARLTAGSCFASG